MKKFLVILLIIISFSAIITNDNLNSFFSKKKSDLIQRDKYFHKLSFKYYGTPKYNKELALINQAVILNSDLDLNENNLIIPSFDALIHLYETYDMSLANNIVQKVPNNKLSAKNSIKIKLFESSMAPPFVGIVIILAVVLGYILGRKRSKREIRLANLSLNPNKKTNNKNEKDLVTVQNKDELLINFRE